MFSWPTPAPGWCPTSSPSCSRLALPVPSVLPTEPPSPSSRLPFCCWFMAPTASLLFHFYSTNGLEVLLLVSLAPTSSCFSALQSPGSFPFGGQRCAVSDTWAWDAKPSSASVACPSHPMWSEVSGSLSRNFAGFHRWVQHVLSVYVICHSRWHVVLQISTNILEFLVVTQLGSTTFTSFSPCLFCPLPHLHNALKALPSLTQFPTSLVCSFLFSNNTIIVSSHLVLYCHARWSHLYPFHEYISSLPLDVLWSHQGHSKLRCSTLIWRVTQSFVSRAKKYWASIYVCFLI